MKTMWVLTAFDKKTETFVADYDMPEFDAEAWQVLYGEEVGSPTVGGYTVLPEHVSFLQTYINAPLDIDQFDYVVELCSLP